MFESAPIHRSNEAAPLPLRGQERCKENEFRQPISVDHAPHGSVCEWCGKPAVQQLTGIGGRYHNDGGFFCRTCGEEFARTVADSLSRVVTADLMEEVPY